MVSSNGDERILREKIANLEAIITEFQQSEERMTIALAESAVGLFDWRLDIRSVYLSPVLQTMLGYAGQRMPEDFESWLWHIHADDRSRAQSELREALTYGKQSFQAVYKINRKDGTVRLYLFRAVIMRQSRADGGEPTRVLGTAVDVTDLQVQPPEHG